MTLRPSRQLRLAARRPVAVRVVADPVKRPVFVRDREWWMLVTSSLAAGGIIALFAGALASLYGLIPWSVVGVVAAVYVLPAIAGFVLSWLPFRLARGRGNRAKRVAAIVLLVLVLVAAGAAIGLNIFAANVP